ncbi:hypothetical protein RRG08_023669 [Elysia crispata]|uniref:Uncharacterized protein n=1 Tax=Elysia crispata TaxID=231223 RepID=A0AAE0XSM2_9GAST|nr:hypothetical protein RRG08_023669 [Elysia crispata]
MIMKSVKALRESLLTSHANLDFEEVVLSFNMYLLCYSDGLGVFRDTALTCRHNMAPSPATPTYERIIMKRA